MPDWSLPRRQRQTDLVRSWLPNRPQATAAPAAPQAAPPVTPATESATAPEQGRSPRRTLVELLQSLFDTASRRERQAAELRKQIASLETQHQSAVVAGDDDAADTIWRKLEAARIDLRAVDAAIATAKQHTASAKQSAEAEAREAQHADALFKIHRAEDLALVFDAVVNGMDSLTDQGLVAEARAAGSVADAWRVYEEAAEAAVAAAAVARIQHTTIALRPTKVWNLVWWHFTSAVQRDAREPRLLPQGGSKSREMDTLADHIARERRGEKAEA